MAALFEETKYWSRLFVISDLTGCTRFLQYLPSYDLALPCLLPSLTGEASLGNLSTVFPSERGGDELGLWPFGVPGVPVGSLSL